MIKRIIFDIDNTLIKWKSDYVNALRDTVIEYKLNIDYKDMDNLIETYENYYSVYTKDNFVKLFNDKLGINIGTDFIDSWFKKLSLMAEYDEDIYNTLKYLSSKYELVILTNFFREVQIKRLEKARIRVFFSYVNDSSKVIKPNKEAFIDACGKHNIDECVMVGDNYFVDIDGALKSGMKAYWVTDNIDITNYDVVKINSINDLVNYL